MSICVTTIFTAIAGFKYRISTIQILIEESAEKRAPSTEKHIKKMKWWKGHDFHFGFIRIGNVIATHKMRNVEKGGNWWVENAKKHIFKSFVNISLHSLSFSLLVFHLLFLHWLEKEGFRFSFLSLRVIYTNALRRHSQLASQNLFLSSAFCSEYFMVPPESEREKTNGKLLSRALFTSHFSFLILFFFLHRTVTEVPFYEWYPNKFAYKKLPNKQEKCIFTSFTTEAENIACFFSIPFPLRGSFHIVSKGDKFHALDSVRLLLTQSWTWLWSTTTKVVQCGTGVICDEEGCFFSIKRYGSFEWTT